MKTLLLGGLATLLATSHVCAGPAEYVFVPNVVKGEREIDFKFGTQSGNVAPSQQAASLGVGYGATSRWFTELYVKATRESGRNNFDAVEWENKFQLTETGEYPVDVGFILEFELPHDRREGNEFRFGPLFQVEYDRLQLNFNPLLTNITRSRDGNGTYFGYQWQARYRWQPAFDFGAQGFGDMGRWKHFDPAGEQNHRLGPAAFGKVNLDGRQAIVWNAALLFGMTSASPDTSFRLQAEYEF